MQADPSAASNYSPLPERARSLITPDRRIRPHLDGDESLLGRRTESMLTRVDELGLEADGVPGSVYLTDRRLIHLSSDVPTAQMTIDLREVTELSLSGQRLLITFHPTRGVMLDLESPIDFRAQMALAISSLRGRE